MSPHTRANSDINLQVGGTMEFGGYEWVVLDLQGSKALLLSKDIIECRAYHDKYQSVTWKKSGIRKYLNGEFYNRFSAGERALIAETRVINIDNQWYGTSGGNDTNDMIFLLSLEEVTRYFGDIGKLTGAKHRGYWLSDEYNEKRIAYRSISCKLRSLYWWLRSPGNYSILAASVWNDGYVDVTGDSVDDNNGGVRPALWLNLES